jgi:hypothetical protein
MLTEHGDTAGWVLIDQRRPNCDELIGFYDSKDAAKQAAPAGVQPHEFLILRVVWDEAEQAEGSEGEIERLREALEKAARYLNPDQGSEVDVTAARYWLRTAYLEGHPNYLSPEAARAALERGEGA